MKLGRKNCKINGIKMLHPSRIIFMQKLSLFILLLLSSSYSYYLLICDRNIARDIFTLPGLLRIPLLNLISVLVWVVSDFLF